MAENIVDEIQTINGIPLCDTEARNLIDVIEVKMKKINDATEHVHEEYITRDIVIDTYVTKLDLDSILEDLNLSDCITKEELESMNFLTNSMANSIYATKDYVDTEINEVKMSVNNTLTSYATRTYANEINNFAKELEKRINALENEHNQILIEIENLKNK